MVHGLAQMLFSLDYTGNITQVFKLCACLLWAMLHTLTIHNIQLKNTSFTFLSTSVHDYNAHIMLSIRGQRENNFSASVRESDG